MGEFDVNKKNHKSPNSSSKQRTDSSFHSHEQSRGTGSQVTSPALRNRFGIPFPGNQGRTLPPSQAQRLPQSTPAAAQVNTGDLPKQSGKPKYGLGRNEEDRITLVHASSEGEIYKESTGADANPAHQRVILGLRAAMEEAKGEGLMSEEGLKSPLTSLDKLLKNDADYSRTKAGRQYLLFVFSNVERNLSRYIDAQVQRHLDTEGNQHRFRIPDVVPHYETIARILDAVRYEHARTVDIIADSSRKDYDDTELPIYEKNLSPEEREKRLSLWKFITQNEKVKWEEKDQNESSKDNTQFRSEMFSYAAKMLETNIGTELWDMARASGKELTLRPRTKPGSDASGAEIAMRSKLPQGSSGQTMKLENEGSNIFEVMRQIARQKSGAVPEAQKMAGVHFENQQSPAAADGSAKMEKAYFAAGSNTALQMPMGQDYARSVADIGRDGRAVQTIPWLIFAHEMGHAVKNMLGCNMNGEFMKQIATKERITSSAEKSEELANSYIENALRREIGIEQREEYYNFDSLGLAALEGYLLFVHENYMKIKNNGLEDADPKIENFMREFEKRQDEQPFWYSLAGVQNTEYNMTEKYSPTESGVQLKQLIRARAERSVNRINMFHAEKQKSYRMSSFDELARSGVVNQLEQKLTRAFRQIRKPIDLRKFEKSAYQNDAEFQDLKDMLQHYNSLTEYEMSIADLRHLIFQIDLYIKTNGKNSEGKSQHKGRIAFLNSIKAQLQGRLETVEKAKKA